jgi:hypothetical protein
MRPNFSFLKIFLFLFSFLIFNSSFLIATIRYVNPNGNNIPPYLTFEDGAWKIQDCIDVSFFNDTIYVANGVYEEQVVMIPGLSLIGSGTDSCIVDSSGFPLTNNRTITMLDSCLVKVSTSVQVIILTMVRGIYTEGQTALVTENKFSNANTGIIWESIFKCIKITFLILGGE